MKLRNIFTALTAAAFVFVGCQKESEFLDEVQVSKSFVTLDVNGGEASITVKASADWAFETSDVWPEVIVKDKDGNETSRTPSWLSVDVTSGAAGETEVTFSAEATTETREVTLLLACAGVKQNVKVLQMAEKVEVALSTCAEVNNNGVDGKVYRVKGTCTSIANTQYGNWYLTDETGTVYVYGTLYNGATQQFTKLGLEVGDIVTVEGPRKNYNGTIELVDVTVLEIEKSLIKLEKVFPAEPLPLEGGVATALLTVKAGDFSVEIPEDATWLTAGEPADLGGLTSVELTAAPNEGGARKTTVTFKTNVDGKDYIAMADVEQLGAIAAVSVADFLAAPEGTALYELTGIVKNLANTTYGNFDLVDATGSVYVYGLTGNGAIGSNDKTFANLGINEGDVVTIIGTRASYKETAQVGGTAYLKEHVVVAKAATVTEFLAEAKGTWCKVTGTIANIKSDVYGNFDLVGEDGASVYVYGLTTSYVARNDKTFANLGLKEGDIVTLVGKRDSYNDQDQVGGPAYYISHVEGAPAVDPWEAEGVATYVLDEFMYTDYPQYCALTELKAYADETNVYARLKTTKTSGVGMLRLCTADTGEGSESVWYWEKTTYATPVYKSSKAKVDENFNFELSYNGAAVGLETKIEGEDVYWIMTIPRSAHDHAKNAGTMHLGFVSYTAAEAENGFMPKVWGEMLKVTLP